MYEKLEPQTYISSPLFNNSEVSLLFALRSRYIDCKANFKSKYHNGDLLCQVCAKSEENQNHLLECDILNRKLKSEDIIKEKAEYNDIFKDVKKQKVIVTLFSKLLEIRKKILNEQQLSNPSILDKMLKNRYDLQKCIVSGSFGN